MSIATREAQNLDLVRRYFDATGPSSRSATTTVLIRGEASVPVKRRPPANPWDAVLRAAAHLPGVVEGTSYGTPALRVGKRFFVRLREDGETLVLPVRFEERDYLLRNQPTRFYLTDHYRDWPSVLVRVRRTPHSQLRELLEQTWRRLAGKRLLAQLDSPGSAGSRRARK